ncbi:RNA polymerase sigma factor [Thalassoglobus sp.]|uniref:RNA polymerase sigma factor n=1 Tax=Thalassoglobus sp. TaxID=2795869 RepID=UPI003AA9DE02
MVISNEEWGNGLRSGDPVTRDNFTEELQIRLRKAIFAKFIDRGLSGHCVEDVVQETTYRILRSVDSFRGESKFLTWATAFAVRTGLEMLRRGHWMARTTSDFLMESDKVDLADLWKSAAPLPEVDAQQREILQLLATSINDGLTRRQRCALVRELQGWAADRIAQELGTTRGAVYKLVHDAKARLKKVLQEAGLDAKTVRDVFSL